MRAADPGPPEANGLAPASETFYVNTSPNLNNGSTESLGVAIAQNGNVLVGWEDDGDGLSDLEAVWTLYGPAGESLTPETLITSIDPAFAGQSVTTKFLAYFRANGTPVSGWTSWGPKIKANLFGQGLGMGAVSFALANEVVEFTDVQHYVLNDEGVLEGEDFPSVQLLTDAGAPVRILAGVATPYAQRPGAIRIGDWDFLSNGNVVIVGESRQEDDLVTVYGGEAPGRHPIVRVLSSTGAEIKAEQLASATPTAGEMWHGVGVTQGGFGVRFASGGRGTVRLFDNAGLPLSTNIDLGTLAGTEIMAQGGRGDGVGFHGNGKDAYAAVARGANGEGAPEVWVTVLNADGSLRWAKAVNDDIELSAPGGSCDVGIDSSGRVVVVYAGVVGENASAILGRLFGADGVPLGGTFYVSEKEIPSASTPAADGPRVAFRGNSVAVIWESLNGGSENITVGGRLFSVSAIGGLDSVGLARIVPDKLIYKTEADNLNNWEPYASVLGTSTFLVEANTFASIPEATQRFALAFQPTGGGNGALGDVFFADNGVPYQ
ncbi:MAG TPA: hypothetical protein DCE44_11340, partial [Verrucomicrobiales bacterium]|nr:hypothetical protein [Verrucomicrobiales bacterium]